MIDLKFKLLLLVLLCGISISSVFAQQPEYQILSLGQMGEAASGGQAVSGNGLFGAGFSDAETFLWETSGTITPLPSVPGRPFSVPQCVNDSGTVAGIGATTFFGSNALPVIWKNGNAVVLLLPGGETIGRGYGINNAETVVGSVDGGSAERAAMFSELAAGSELTQTLPGGGVLTTAYGVNNAGRIIGQGTDPGNAAVTKGFYLDPGDSQATDIGALTDIGHNSAIAFAVSSNGLITGSSSFNSGVNGRAFLWSSTKGMLEIDLPTGASSASGRGVNDDGWVVGNAGGVTSLPFLYDGTATYLLNDLIVEGGGGWDLTAGTSNGAFSISNNGTIFGRGLQNGQLTAFAMVRQLILGDINGDGVVSLQDVTPFVDLLTSGDFQAEGDINGDGTVDLSDVAPFVKLLSS